MSSTYAGLNVFHVSITIPSDGDPAVSESGNVPWRALQDNSTYLLTQLSHQAADDRGKTSTITGAIVWNDGGGSFQVQIDTTFNGTVDLFSPVTFHAGADFACFADARFTNDVTVGNTGTDQFTVNSTSDFYAPVSLHDDLTSGHKVTITGADGKLIVSAGATTDIAGDAQLTHTGDTATIGGDLTCSSDVRVNGTLRAVGSNHFGNSSTDAHEFTGDVTMGNDLSVGGDITGQGAINIDGGSGSTIGGNLSVGNLSIAGNTTVGNSSSDTLTLNAKLGSVMNFVNSGRVPRRLIVSSGPSAATYTPADGNTVLLFGLGSWTVLLDTTGAQDGDFWDVFNESATSVAAPVIQFRNLGGTITSMTLTQYQRVSLVYVSNALGSSGWMGGRFTYLHT